MKKIYKGLHFVSVRKYIHIRVRCSSTSLKRKSRAYNATLSVALVSFCYYIISDFVDGKMLNHFLISQDTIF